MRFRRLATTLPAFAFALAATDAIAAPFSTGDFITYSQDSWGGDPGIEPAAHLVWAQFDTTYTAGLEVGVSGGAGFSMLFTSAPDLLFYLPGTGVPRVLTADLVNPSSGATGELGGEVVALQLNVDFSGAAYLTGTAATPFADLVLTDLLFAKAFNGLTIREFLARANNILGGGLNPGTDDELMALLEDVNGAFAGGVPSSFAQDHLRADLTEPVPEPATLTLVGVGAAVLGVRRAKRRSWTRPR